MLPAINNIIGLSKELARDQSILTLYKIFKGLPLFWKVIQMCGDCGGTGKSGEEKCGTCNGHGKYVGKNDVTDVIEVPLPEGDEKLLSINFSLKISLSISSIDLGSSVVSFKER